MSNNEKMLKEILTIRKIKENLENFKFMPKNEMATFFKSLEEYENYLKQYIQANNSNLELFEELDIEPTNKEVEVPYDPNNSKYEELRTLGLRLSLEEKVVYISNLYRSLPSYIMALEIPKEEEILIYKSLKAYANELSLQKKRNENNAKYNSDIYTPSDDNKYVPLSNDERFNSLYDSYKKNEEKSK